MKKYQLNISWEQKSNSFRFFHIQRLILIPLKIVLAGLGINKMIQNQFSFYQIF